MSSKTQFAFVSRHLPTAEQVALAAKEGVELVHVGDMDAFTIGPGMVFDHGAFEGVVVVHPAAAMRLAGTFLIGVFRAADRPPVGEAAPSAPRFTEFHIYDLRD